MEVEVEEQPHAAPPHRRTCLRAAAASKADILVPRMLTLCCSARCRRVSSGTTPSARITQATSVMRATAATFWLDMIVIQALPVWARPMTQDNRSPT